MDYIHLGRTGLLVSPLCLGTMNFGPLTTEGDSHAIMDRALEHGINFFDTANVYGWRKGEGVTEQIVGRWFARGEGRRDKVDGAMGDWPNQSKLSAASIIRECEASLRRLQTDRIDLYQMHHVDLDTPWEEIWQAMDVLIGQGKVVYVGSSNFAAWNIVQANDIAPLPPLPWPGQRAVALQPGRADHRAGAAAGLPRLRRGRDPLEPPVRWAARRHPAQDRAAGPQRQRPRRRGPAQAAAAGPGLRELLRRTRRAARRRRPGLAAAPAGRHRPDHRPPHHRAPRRRHPRH